MGAGVAAACAQAKAWLRVTGAGMSDYAPQILSKAADKNSVILSIYCMEDFASPSMTGGSLDPKNFSEPGGVQDRVPGGKDFCKALHDFSGTKVNLPKSIHQSLPTIRGMCTHTRNHTHWLLIVDGPQALIMMTNLQKDHELSLKTLMKLWRSHPPARRLKVSCVSLPHACVRSRTKCHVHMQLLSNMCSCTHTHTHTHLCAQMLEKMRIQTVKPKEEYFETGRGKKKKREKRWVKKQEKCVEQLNAFFKHRAYLPAKDITHLLVFQSRKVQKLILSYFAWFVQRAARRLPGPLHAQACDAFKMMLDGRVASCNFLMEGSTEAMQMFDFSMKTGTPVFIMRGVASVGD